MITLFHLKGGILTLFIYKSQNFSPFSWQRGKILTHVKLQVSKSIPCILWTRYIQDDRFGLDDGFMTWLIMDSRLLGRTYFVNILVFQVISTWKLSMSILMHQFVSYLGLWTLYIFSFLLFICWQMINWDFLCILLQCRMILFNVSISYFVNSCCVIM